MRLQWLQNLRSRHQYQRQSPRHQPRPCQVNSVPHTAQNPAGLLQIARFRLAASICCLPGRSHILLILLELETDVYLIGLEIAETAERLGSIKADTIGPATIQETILTIVDQTPTMWVDEGLSVWPKTPWNGIAKTPVGVGNVSMIVLFGPVQSIVSVDHHHETVEPAREMVSGANAVPGRDLVHTINMLA